MTTRQAHAQQVRDAWYRGYAMGAAAVAVGFLIGAALTWWVWSR